MFYSNWQQIKLVRALLMRFITLALTLIPLCFTGCFSTPKPVSELPMTAEAVPTDGEVLVVEQVTAVVEQPITSHDETATPTVVFELETAVSPTFTPGSTDTSSISSVQCQPHTDWSPYIVQVGDTLYSIAQRIGSTVAELQNGNCLSDVNRIDVSQQLYLPSSPATATTAIPPTATLPSSETAVPIIHSFSLISDEMVGDMRHVTLSWSYSGGQGRLVAGTYRRFSQWLNVPPGDTHTFELRGTAYENPPITLSVLTDDDGAGDISQSIYLDWPCEHSYFFGYVPHRCPYAPAATTNASQQDFENGRMIWLAETDSILVLYDDGNWKEYDNAWQEGDPIDDPAIQAPSGLFQPIRGFGEVWRNQNEHDGVRDRLGWAVAPEQAYTITFQHSIAESVGQNLLYLTLQDGVLVYQLTGYDLGSGPWAPVPPAEAANN